MKLSILGMFILSHQDLSTALELSRKDHFAFALYGGHWLCPRLGNCDMILELRPGLKYTLSP